VFNDQNPLLVGKPIRGWLMALVLALGFLAPAAAWNDYTEMQQVVAGAAGKVVVRAAVLNAHALLLLSYAVLGMYTANVLWQKKPGAVARAKANLLGLAVVALAADLCALAVLDAPNAATADTLFAAAFRVPRVALIYGIPYLYLCRSWRVKDTYTVDLPNDPTETSN